MRAIDTNVIVRFLTRDDPIQTQAARAAFEAGDIFIATTVLLETEWVLRSAYGYTPLQISEAIRALAGLDGVTVEQPLRLTKALDWHASGMDFADALHLAGADECEAFLTFDHRLTKAAKDRSPVRVEQP